MNEFDLRSFLYKNTLLEKKEDSKEGNKEEQKRAEGAIKDDEKHAKKLKKDARFQKEKLAQLKKDYDRDVKKVKSGAVKEAQGYDARLDDAEGAKHGEKKQDMAQRRADSENMEKADGKRKFSGDSKMDEEMEDKKLTKEGLKDMIREKITSILNEDAELYEAEEDNVDVDVEKDVDIDVKDEVDIDDESVESDVEVKTSVPGADKDTSEVLGLLTKASEASDAFTDDPELKTQIGNTITYFTRKHVAKI